MRRLFVALSSAVSVVALTHMASAADLYQPVYKAAPPPPVPVYNWTGFYVGGHAGWGWTSSDSGTATLSGGPVTPNKFAPQSFNFDNDSPIAGLQAGYNYQFVSWVLGIEGDISGARLTSSQIGPGIFIGPSGSAPPCVTGSPCGNVNMTEDLRWLASVRGRLGYAWGPGLFYVTGGAAWTDVKYSATTSIAAFPTANLATSFSSTRSGPVVGAGYEWMLSPHWTLRGEFLHYWFNNAPVAAVTSGPTTPPLVATNSWSRFDVNVARLGLNYKF